VTVGATILAEDGQDALADAAGRVSVRRIVDAAWAGGALPIVVVAPDPEGRVTAALAGSPATVVDPGAAVGAQAASLGVRAALDAVADTQGLLLWPARYTWVDPETVTSLIEASGRAAPARRPVRLGEVGWPVLVPTDLALAWLDGSGRTLAEALAGRPIEVSELGDPGTVLGREVGLDELPPYAGPPGPLGGPPPEWGAAAADTPDPEV
jgi:CTP:molybdopterin cytidylyltransferase MocA